MVIQAERKRWENARVVIDGVLNIIGINVVHTLVDVVAEHMASPLEESEELDRVRLHTLIAIPDHDVILDNVVYRVVEVVNSKLATDVKMVENALTDDEAKQKSGLNDGMVKIIRSSDGSGGYYQFMLCRYAYRCGNA